MSTPFIKQVAAALHDKYGDGVSSLSVVFPNRRAGLFFGKALSEIIEKPLWQPASITIGGLMEEISGLVPGERLRLIAELYKIYKEFHPGETFEKFYFWGELLLGDFDSIDKYLIDADTLFSNLVDLHELDNRFDYLSDEQRAIITKFWGSFRRGAFSAEQADFLDVWRTLAPIYHGFRARLRELGIAYEGMVYREAAERIRQSRAPQIVERHYVIAGFNALSRCEQTLFDWLQKTFRTDFYWDYDDYFLADRAQEAGRFMRDNLRRFPQASELSGGHKNFEKPKKIRSVAAASDVVQCKFAGRILSEIARKNSAAPGIETAVVLADESLLTPLLYSMPQGVTDINITMGYPLRMHPAYTFLERQLVKNLKTSDDWHDVSGWLIEAISQAVETDEPAEKIGQNAQFFELILDHLSKLAASIDDAGIELEAKTYALLLRRSLQSVTVPFEGEPLEGVQVMGILETRALDFENIVFLSCGDGTMPGNLTGAPSFIPYNLKMAYGMPTPEHHEGVYAYHLFRLLGRAKNIDMVWSSVADEKSTGEPSRYILQLDYESPHHVEHQSVTVDVNLSPNEPVTVEKNVEVMERLGEFTRAHDPKTLSPSTFFTYVECPLKFYFRAVAGLRAPEEEADGVDNALFGDILHGAMHRLYAPLVGGANPQKKIRELPGSDNVERAVDEAIRELTQGAESSAMSGAMLLARRTITDYIERNILPFDAARGENFTIEKLEREISAEFPLDGRGESGRRGEGGRSVTFRGRVDRLDRLSDGTLRVIDYKTGSPKPPGSDSAVFQIQLYTMILQAGDKAGGEVQKVEPALYFVRDLSADILKSAAPMDEFETRLHAILAEIFDPETPFTQCPDPTPCTWCEYAGICRRGG